MRGVGEARVVAEAGFSAHIAVGTPYTRQVHRALRWELEAQHPIGARLGT